MPRFCEFTLCYAQNSVWEQFVEHLTCSSVPKRHFHTRVAGVSVLEVHRTPELSYRSRILWSDEHRGHCSPKRSRRIQVQHAVELPGTGPVLAFLAVKKRGHVHAALYGIHSGVTCFQLFGRGGAEAQGRLCYGAKRLGLDGVSCVAMQRVRTYGIAML